jgi:hypothetical protein
MQFVTVLAQMFDSGKLTLSTKNKEEFVVTAANKRIDVNLKDKEFIKELVSDTLKNNEDKSAYRTIKDSPKSVSAAKNMREMLIETANDLRQAGITVTLSYKDDVVATAGAQASAGISRLLTGTKALEINSLTKLAELGIAVL